MRNVIKSFVPRGTIHSEIEKKDLSVLSGQSSFIGFLLNSGYQGFAWYALAQYYTQCSPLASAINEISSNAISIERLIWNNVKKEYINKDPLLDLLNNPNAQMTSDEFYNQIYSDFLLTGNAFIMATGRPNQKALELFCISPQFILLAQTTNSYVTQINYQSSINNIVFYAKEENGRIRYYDETGLREIYHIKNYNPYRGPYNQWGMSKLTTLFYEIEQFIKGNVHNASLLTRGGRPSGILAAKEALDPEQYARLQQQMDLFIAGPTNAGRLLLTEGDSTFSELGTTNKDMDYLKGKEELKDQIYVTFKIPLALISKSSMTYNNLQTSELQLFSRAVLPEVNYVNAQLTSFLMHRYKTDWMNYELAYDESSIKALSVQHNEQRKVKKESGIFTINELRNMEGLEPVEGGDEIYMPATNTPIAFLSEPAIEEETQNNDYDSPTKSQFIKIMQKQVNSQGLRKYTDQEIEKAYELY